jgi:hypothetical protein
MAISRQTARTTLNQHPMDDFVVKGEDWNFLKGSLGTDGRFF